MDDNEELDERNEHDVVELKVDVSDAWCRRVKGASRYFFLFFPHFDLNLIYYILGEKIMDNS